MTRKKLEAATLVQVWSGSRELSPGRACDLGYMLRTCYPLLRDELVDGFASQLQTRGLDAGCPPLLLTVTLEEVRR